MKTKHKKSKADKCCIDACVKVLNKKDLTEKESYEVFRYIAKGKISQGLLRLFLEFLHLKEESVNEIVGARNAFMKDVPRLHLPNIKCLMDVCGTGGTK